MGGQWATDGSTANFSTSGFALITRDLREDAAKLYYLIDYPGGGRPFYQYAPLGAGATNKVPMLPAGTTPQRYVCFGLDQDSGFSGLGYIIHGSSECIITVDGSGVATQAVSYLSSPVPLVGAKDVPMM